MRALMVLVALIATPAFAAVAQNRGQAAAGVSADGKCVTADDHRSDNSWDSGRPEDKKGRDRVGCAPLAPSCSLSPGTGTLSISGRVLRSVEPFDGLPGWCIELRVNGTVVATAMSNGTWNDRPNYSATSLPSGTYLVCQVMQPGWVQVRPSSGPLCPSGNFGKTVVLTSMNVSFVDFRNKPQ